MCQALNPREGFDVVKASRAVHRWQRGRVSLFVALTVLVFSGCGGGGGGGGGGGTSGTSSGGTSGTSSGGTSGTSNGTTSGTSGAVARLEIEAPRSTLTAIDDTVQASVHA